MTVLTILILIWIGFFSYRYIMAWAETVHCETESKEKKLSKRISLMAIGFGVFIWVLSFILVTFVY